MTALTIGISPSWALWVAAHAALLYAAYRFVAPFVARLKPGQRNARADGLDIVYDPSENQTALSPQFEIVAVHGLGAHPEHTWEGKSIDKVKPKVHLLRDLLPRAFPTARILSFSYNSDWLVDAPEKTAQQIGHRLAERLAKHRGEALRLPIIFIGHSFGGIVIKQALCVMDRSSIILEDTCGIIFLGTPHQGSSLSIAASLLGKLTALLGSNTALLLTLQSNHNQLSDLEDNFRRVAADKQITSFYETKPTFYLGFSIGCIVNRESARGFAKDPVSIDTDHAGLNKFNSPAHPGFKAIKTVIEKLRAKPLIQQADDVLFNKHYTSAKLMIKRLSGEELPMDQCYINLSIVEQVQAEKPSQDEGEAKDSAPKSSPFSLFARLNIETSSDKSQVQLKDLFSQRKRTDGTEISPRRVLIRGRAGVGKTTLCKKMVHEFVGDAIWRDLFDRVLWIPLRNLKGRPAPGYNLERFLFDEFFRLQGDKPGKRFAEETSKALKDNRTLLILDGWDEVNQIATANSDMSRFLCDELLRQPNIIITSRPYASIPVQGQPIDLELETIGFNPTQVDEYIEKTHDKTDAIKVGEIKTFLQRHGLVRSLVRIPIQLDAFCYCWDDNNYGSNNVDTMTALYQAIQTSLWKKDIPRLGEEHGIPTAQTNELKHSDQVLIEKNVREEIGFLEHLAFDGLVADRLEFDWGDINRTWAKEITHDRTRSPGNTLPCLSFLRTSDPSAKSVGQSHHFIHLTFQEYYAARYFVRHWNSHQSFEPNQQSQEPIMPHTFLHKHKYDARYDVMWRFVAGLLDETKNADSFFEEIELEPVDVLGPAHQRLVMHCLNEALNLPEELRKQREDKLFDWVLFERDFTGWSTFIRESEMPEGVLHRAMRASGDKRVFLDVLRYSQRHLSDATMAALVELFKDEDSDVRESAAYALGKQSTLSDAIVTALMKLFKHEESYVRRSAANALGEQSTLSDAAIAALMELFKDKNRNIQMSAAEALGKQSTLSDATMAALVELLKDEESYVRRSAANALGKQSTLSDATMAALVELFKDEDSNVRWSAAEALGNQSTFSDATMAALVELFKDEDSDVQESAAYALGKQSTLSDAIVTALMKLFKHEESYVRRSAADALGEQSTLSDAAIAALVELFKDKNRNVRMSAAEALGKQSTLSDATVAALMELFKDEDSDVRESAAYALGKQSTFSDATMAALVELFKDEDSDVRESAAYALGKQSTLSDAIVTALMKLFKHVESYVRRSAANALGEQSTLSDAAIAALVELFKDKNRNVRMSAAEALGKQSTLSDATVAALVELLKDEESYVRRSAADALGEQSTLSDATMAALVELFKDEDSNVRWSAAEALGNQSTFSDATMAALVELFKDEDSDVRESAAYALGKQSTFSDATMAALVELFKDEDSEVRMSAARALGKQSTFSDATMAALVELLKDEESYVRSSAAKALGEQSTLSDAAIAALVELFKDKNRNVRMFAAEALGKQSTLSDATMAALVELFKDEESYVRSSAAEALVEQSTLSDKILDALGLSIQPQTRTQLVPYSLCHSQDVAAFYESFLRRSFREHFSLHVGETFCIINQASVIRKATLQDQRQFQEAIRRARNELEQDLYLPSLYLS